VPAPRALATKLLIFINLLQKSVLQQMDNLKKDFIAKNPLTGYYEGSGNATGSNNAYGLPNAYYTHGNSMDLNSAKVHIFK
jgi:hypothetical protein